jgi:penicillin-binding protein 1A
MSRRERQRRRQRHRGHPVKRVLVMTGVLSVCGVALAALALVGWVVGVAESAPDIKQLKPQDPGQTSEVFAADGSSLGKIQSDILRTVVHNQQIPAALKKATVAIEDRRFYKHKGVDYQGVLRAAIKDIFGGGKSIQGGSTLTMQLVRNLYLPKSLADTRTIKRKIIEAKLAEELERNHTKPWILTTYLNDVSYGTWGGQTAVGVGAAAQMFFNKPVWKLSLAQSALLAGLPQAPSQYNPFLNRDVARQRRHDVLLAMVQSRYIDQAQAAAADGEPLGVQRNTSYTFHKEQYFFDYVKQALFDKFGVARVRRGGLKVYSTIDLKKQQEARDAIQSNEGQPGDPAASLVTIDPSNGHILAMASSSTYSQTNFNYAAQAHRQTGSAFKLFVLMTAIHDYNADPAQTYYDSHHLTAGWLPGYPTYDVQTAEKTSGGTMNLFSATAQSDNTIFAQLAADVGWGKIRDTAYSMGITSHLDAFPAEALGGLRLGVSSLEMADAYATIANGGYHIAPTAITKVVFGDGSVANLGDPPKKQVFSDGEAATATDVLKGVITGGTGTAANYGCPAAGKTGTTTSYTDAWFVGFTPKLSTAVWVGFPNRTTSMYDVNGLGPGFGGTLAAPIWHDYMAKASDGYCGDFPPPQNPFHGTAFFGKFASTGSGNTTPGGNGSSTTGTTTTSTTSTGTTTNPYANPKLYQHLPQPPSHGATGTLPGAPPGFGTGHSPSSGGAGIKTQ